jgi:hypothetical protein
VNDVLRQRRELVDKGKHRLAEIYRVGERLDDGQRHACWWGEQHPVDFVTVIVQNVECKSRKGKGLELELEVAMRGQ